MDATAYHRSTEARQQTFSREIDESKTRNLDVAKNGSGRRCTAVCQDNSCACIKSARASQPLPIAAVHVSATHRHHPVPRDSIYIGLTSMLQESRIQDRVMLGERAIPLRAPGGAGLWYDEMKEED